MNILFEDEYILAAVKPQGMPSQADKTGDPDLLSELEAYTGQSLGLLHRLDRPVGGVMLFAKEKKAEAGTFEDYLLKNARTNLSEVVAKDRKGAKKAILHYTKIAEKETDIGWVTLAEIKLETGRHHQIRVQTSHAGVPIWGDRKYHKNFPKRGKTDIALWSYRLEGTHPKTKQPFTFVAKPEKEPFSLFADVLREL